jgi:hypothetical protein
MTCAYIRAEHLFVVTFGADIKLDWMYVCLESLACSDII